jgi:hypothetical protein
MRAGTAPGSNRSLPILAALALILLPGCEQQPPQKPGANTGQRQAIQAAAETRELAQPQTAQPGVAFESLQTGDYSLQIDHGEISLVSAWASRIAILQDLSRKIGFELYDSAARDDQVLVNRSRSGIEDILGSLLAGVEYQVEYNAQADANGFRIARLYLGQLSGARPSADGETEIQAREDPASAISQTDAPIYLGDDLEQMDLAARLEFGTDKMKIDAIAELDIDPAGLNAAYQVYSRSRSAKVRMAVLELVEAEDNFLARSMVADSLQSTDPEEALYALSIVESLDDFSLAPRVQSLSAHHDAEVRKRAREVLQSLTSDFSTDDEADAAIEILNLPGPRRIREESGNHR